MNIIQLRRSRLVKLVAVLAIIGLVFYAANGSTFGKSYDTKVEDGENWKVI